MCKRILNRKSSDNDSLRMTNAYCLYMPCQQISQYNRPVYRLFRSTGNYYVMNSQILYQQGLFHLTDLYRAQRAILSRGFFGCFQLTIRTNDGMIGTCFNKRRLLHVISLQDDATLASPHMEASE